MFYYEIVLNGDLIKADLKSFQFEYADGYSFLDIDNREGTVFDTVRKAKHKSIIKRIDLIDRQRAINKYGKAYVEAYERSLKNM